MQEDLLRQQQKYCEAHGARLVESPGHLQVAVAQDMREGGLPISGRRSHPQGLSTGWALWTGQHRPADAARFVFMTVENLQHFCPAALKFLGFPPGWRFEITDDSEHVWQEQ